MNEFAAICYLFSPLLAGLTFHGFCIKFRWLDFLTRPIDGGRVFRGKPLFGQNKTYRGLAAIAVGTAIGFTLQSLWLHHYDSFRRLELLDYSLPFSIALGVAVGLAAALSELPNSFVKRQIDIAPGETAGGLENILFYILDQVDFLLGCWVVLAFVVEITLIRVFYSFIFLFMSHQIISGLGYILGMRKTAR